MSTVEYIGDFSNKSTYFRCLTAQTTEDDYTLVCTWPDFFLSFIESAIEDYSPYDLTAAFSMFYSLKLEMMSDTVPLG